MNLPAALAALASAAERCADVTARHLSDEPLAAGRLTDDQLLDAQRILGGARRDLDTATARLAAEIAHRSRRELGYDGLAQRQGLRTPEALVQRVAGSSSDAARRLIRVGTVLAEHASAQTPPSQPWLRPAAQALADGLLSVEALDAIRLGIGRPSTEVPAEVLLPAVEQLATQAASLTIEQLEARARELRDSLDEAGVASREAERRDRRYLRLIPQSDGMTRLIGLLDPESAAIVTDAVDLVTAPRRGGPRFVDSAAVARAQRIIEDDRTTEQLALDGLVQMVRLAGSADDGSIFGTGRPSLRVHVTARDLDRRQGAAHIEGQSAGVSIETAERAACAGGLVPILFDDDGQSVNLGRTRRRFTARQRDALAARDGGCRFPDCERPPSWTEAHHIREWRHGGRTDLADGILLCRHHHLLIHNNGWRIEREGGRYRLIPPAEHDPARTPIDLPTKSAAGRRLAAAS